MQKTKRKYENLITSMTVLLILVILLIAFKPTTEDNGSPKTIFERHRPWSLPEETVNMTG